MGKRSKTIRVTIYDDAEFINELDEALDHVVTILGVSELEYLRSGIVQLILNKQVELVNEGKYGALDAKVAKIRQAKYDKKRLFGKLDTIYKEEGPTGVFACAELEPELSPELIQEFMEQYTWRNEDMTASKRMQDWLGEFLGDGELHSTTEVRDAAQRDEIITNDETEWSYLRVIGARIGVSQTGVRGFWRLNK